MRGALLDSFKQVFPPGAAALIATTMRQLNERAIVGAGAILAGVSAVWGALNGTWAVMAGLNKAYEVREERPSWQVLSIAFGPTIILSILDLIALAAILYGNRAEKILGQHLGSPAHVELLWRIIQWTIILILLLFSFSLLYRFGPNGEANSEIEKAAENASHPGARRPAEQRSGGGDSSKQ